MTGKKILFLLIFLSASAQATSSCRSLLVLASGSQNPIDHFFPSLLQTALAMLQTQLLNEALTLGYRMHPLDPVARVKLVRTFLQSMGGEALINRAIPMRVEQGRVVVLQRGQPATQLTTQVPTSAG